jgi:hypothetical protein
MTKPTKTRAELERMIVSEVRKYPHCEGFKSVTFYRVVDQPFNWSLSLCDYGEAGMDSCDAALRGIISRLQRQYDLADDQWN